MYVYKASLDSDVHDLLCLHHVPSLYLFGVLWLIDRRMEFSGDICVYGNDFSGNASYCFLDIIETLYVIHMRCHIFVYFEQRANQFTPYIFGVNCNMDERSILLTLFHIFDAFWRIRSRPLWKRNDQLRNSLKRVISQIYSPTPNSSMPSLSWGNVLVCVRFVF